MAPRRRASSIAASLSAAPIAAAAGGTVDDDVVDPRLEAGGDAVEGEGQAADDGTVDAGDEQHAVGVVDDVVQADAARRRRRRDSWGIEPLEGGDQLVVDLAATSIVDGCRRLVSAEDANCGGPYRGRRWTHVRLHADPRLRNPVLLYAFTGWNDAGDAASTAIRTIAEHWDAAPLGEIDPEPFTDFATVRPSVYLDDGSPAHPSGRRSTMWSASLPGDRRPARLGPEPALRWRRFGEQVRRRGRATTTCRWPSASAPCSPTTPHPARCR